MVPTVFLILFMGLIVLFQLTFTFIYSIFMSTRNLLAGKPTYCLLLAVKCSSKQLLMLFPPMWCKPIFFLADYWIIWIDSTGTFYGDLVNQREECIGLVGKKLPNLWIRVALASKQPKEAYLSKLNWRFHAEKDSFWARVLRKKYMTQRRMSSSKENSLPSSRTWKAMKKGMDVFNRGTR